MNNVNLGYGQTCTTDMPKEAREQRAHERAIQNCHEHLHKLDALIDQADRVLQPVVLPIPPTTGESGKAVRDCGPAASDVINAVDGVAERINALTCRLSNLVGRVVV